MNKEMWYATLNKCIKPLKCVCGREYNKEWGTLGGFVKNDVTFIWCCSKRCADKTISKLY